MKLDKTAPTITGSRSPAANANGWNNTDITASFSCSDALSGIKSCSSPTTLTSSAANQSVAGTAVDNADNSASATVNGINIDKVAPTLSGAPTTSPNTAGWYNGNVTIHWTLTDTLSGIDPATAPGDSTITGEGSGLTASASVSDKAGNSSGATNSQAVNIDRHAPVSTASVPPTWNNIDVTVNLTGTDALSGVAGTFYTLDGGAQQTGTTVLIKTEGDHTLRYWSVDKAGNTEAANSIHVKIDKTPPTITHSQAPAANMNGWNNGNVTVTFVCGDGTLADGSPGSGVATCTGPQTVTTEGQNQPVTGTTTDNAGNSATDPAKVSIDKTAPVIGAAVDRPANGNGWYNNDVTVSFNCADALSGIDTCPAATTLGEGANQTVGRTAVDAAGNTASASKTGINVDKTAPLLTGAPTTAANADGWYNGNVTIHWTATDGLSGVDLATVPADSVITGEGVNLSAGASVKDKAGNTGTGSSPAVKIDRTAPTTTATAPMGWQNTDVLVSLSPTDNLSGVKHTYFKLDGGAQQTGSTLTISTDGVHTIHYWSDDFAGNVESAKTVTVQVDKSSPTISHSQVPAANQNGWNNTDVTVTFTCADQPGLSGLATCTGPQTVSAEGQNQPVPGTATDNAGNSAIDPATVSIDKTPPTIGAHRDRAPNSFGWYNGDVTVSFTCADTLSGVDSCTPAQKLGEGSNQSAAGTAKDAAGNTATATETGINVDKTDPVLSGAPTTPANSYGWYKGDVQIHWTLTDTLSGIDSASAPADSVITGEGTGLKATASVSDKTGNSSGPTYSAAANIDRTAPDTSVDASPAWNNADVVVNLTANDALSGVKATYYQIDAAATQAGISVAINTEGIHTLTYWSEDKAGNVEAAKTVQVKIDKTAPTIGHSQAPAANSNGWNKTDVTVTFVCADALAGIASCTDPQPVTTEGKDQPVVGTAHDNAGNTATDPAMVSIDKTAPTITGAPDRAANNFGWYKDDVTVSFTCADDRSGVDTCTGPQTLSEGAAQVVTGTVADAAGNSAGTTVGPINIDKTAPNLSGTATVAEPASGWYTGDVTIHWTATDALSGVDPVTVPADSAITGEGDHLTASASVSDKAGNSSGTVSSPVVKIDRTAPTSHATAPDGWNNQDVTVVLNAEDALSGVKAIRYQIDGAPAVTGDSFTLAGEGIHHIAFWSVDNASNVESPNTITVKIDKSDPKISHTQTPVANGAGWNNSDVTFSFTCTDPKLADGNAGSGVAACTNPQTITAEGRNLAVAGTATDVAGNSGFDTALVSIDKTKPTVNAAPDRNPNGAGWYNADVTVSFTCDDTLSGVAACPGKQKLGEGADQSATGTAVDAAGNSASTTLNGLNIDETAPSLSGAPTTPPNTAGWYNSDVTVTWVCSDVLSGIDGGCPADSVVAGEGEHLSTGATVSDIAGNSTSAAVTDIKIDRTAPTTNVSAPSAWVNTNVTVSLTPFDSLSGVQATYYSLDDAPAQTGTSVAISAEGVHTLKYWSVDNAGNAELVNTIQVLIDRTAPTITHTQAPPANGKGWNNTSVTVTFSCSDALSGIASCTGPQNVATEGAAQLVTGKALDNAGNTASDPATVSVDKTPPTISAAPDRPANGYGWYNADVTVSFTCGDSLSGVASCEQPKTVSEGGNQSVSGTAVDAAGNSASTTLNGLNIDETAPSLSGAPTTPPNTAGWYKDSVTVAWTCADALSGIPTGACPPNSVLASEGSDLTASASVSDKAGNTTSAAVNHIKIDKTAPTTRATAPEGWQNQDVTISLAAGDNLSGVKATYYQIDGGSSQTGISVVVSTEGIHQISFWSVDNADNVESANMITIKIDKTTPTINHNQTPAANGKGWNNTDVTVAFTCADQPDLSGIATCTSPQTVTTEGKDQAVTGTATDVAGNSAPDPATVSIDKTKPTINAAPDRSPNGADWYNDDVVVKFTCYDSLSGVASCTPAKTLGEGGNQSTTGAAVDAAGNSDSATLSGLNVDKTAPVLTGAPTTQPNTAGWYKGDVTIHWTPTDALSGIDPDTVPADSIIPGEGSGLTTSASVSDKAGNSSGATNSQAVNIDRHAPTTDASAPSAWVNTHVTVSLSAQDNLSGVTATYYKLDGGATQSGTSVPIDTEGIHTLKYWSVDNAGNVEPENSIQVRIDHTNPTITHTQSPLANNAGWNNTNVTVTFSCADTLSGIASCTTPQTVTAEGKNLPVPGTAVDNAGNSAPDPATVSIDKTKPTISAAPDRPADGYGWYNDDVTITFTCADQADLSGVANCTDAQVLHEGGNQSATGTAVDAAGNSASTTLNHINIDKTAPSISGAPATSANGKGWYKDDVSVAWTCNDALSGIPNGACPPNSTITGEGNNLSATASVSDKAGNTRSASITGIKIDRTAPTTQATAPAGWSNTNVTVILSAQDNLSGVSTTYYKLDGGAPQPGTSVTIGAEGIHMLQYWSVDNADNTEAAHTIQVSIDKTAPQISGAPTTSPNANGWYSGPVTIHFTCSDPNLADGKPGSGVANCQADLKLTSDGASQSITGYATDNAGNTRSVTVGGINIDTKGPVVTIAGVQDGAVYTLGAAPSPSCSATDSPSGLAASCNGTLNGGTANGVGPYTYSARATDKAGNTTVVNVTYRVIYRWDGFLQPINDTAHQIGTSTSIFKGGSTVPVKFQLKKADGTVVQANTLPLWLTPAKGSSTAAAVDERLYGDPATNGSTYRWDGTNQYIYNWGTAGNPYNYYYRIGVTLDDGQTYYVNIGLR